jgi:CRISPR-associated endoribonuclease Cas6
MLYKLYWGGKVIRLKISLKPKKNCALSLNYKYYLAAVCKNVLNTSSENFDDKLKKYNESQINKKSELLTYTGFFCSQHEIKGTRIIFRDIISWYISSPLYELILHLVQEFFSAGSIKIGKEEFEIVGIEASETAEITVMELNKEVFSLSSSREGELYEKLASYYLLSEDEKII